ncbi:hypothetical protein [Mesobacillus foraminis]|uniref:hypothetical protein n=1 Tax=Mesobacillus foraminis TaxID=279826 RepID=UPI00214BDC2B|nr:hypothetical protein [Mesobacillus foraminis]
MGGKEAIRGFLYQGFATILESLTQEFWDRIYVEYPSNDDKVDIALEVNGSITKSIQVKSSINLFKKSDVAKWIKELTNDTKADEYEVVLIGSCDKSANDFVNSIVKYKSGIEDKKSEEALKGFDKSILDNHNISIKNLPIEEATLLGIVRDSLHRYISYKGYMLDFEALNLLSQSALSTQMLLGTKGSSQTKHEFDSKIFQWLELTSGGLKSKKLLARHNLLFYEQEQKILSNSLDGIYMDKYYYYKKFMVNLKKECIDLIDKISNIKLNPVERQKPMQTSNLFGIKSISDFFTTFAETKDSEKEEIINQVKSYFDIDLNGEYFFVGNLMEEKKLGVLGNYSYKYEGTETEKAKNELLNDFKYKLLQYEVILIFIEKIKKYFALPIVIQNVGDVQDENITIKLFIDKSIKVFRGDDYLKDDYLPIYLKMIDDEDNFIESIFKFKSDSKVKAGNSNSNFKHITNQGEIQINDFCNELDMYIAKPQYEDANYNVIELDVQNIRPSESKFVNKLVLLHSLNKDFEIKYKIISNKSNGSNEGILKISYQA